MRVSSPASWTLTDCSVSLGSTDGTGGTRIAWEVARILALAIQACLGVLALRIILAPSLDRVAGPEGISSEATGTHTVWPVVVDSAGGLRGTRVLVGAGIDTASLDAGLGVGALIIRAASSLNGSSCEI